MTEDVLPRLRKTLVRLQGEIAISNALLSMRLYDSSKDASYLDRARELLDQADECGADTRRTRENLACYSP